MKFITTIVLMMSASIIDAHILILTIPKSGTNLLIKCVKLIMDDNPKLININSMYKKNLPAQETIFWAHEWANTLGPNKEKIVYIKNNDLKVLLLVRDPRDLLCAMARAVYKKVNARLINKLLKDIPDLLDKVTGHKNPRCPLHGNTCLHTLWGKYQHLSDLYNDYLKWRDHECAYVVSFEKLVGVCGSGSQSEQITEIMKIADHIGIIITPERAEEISNQLFGDTPTFKIGKIGQWKQILNKRTKKEFKKYDGQLPILLGYENNRNW